MDTRLKHWETVWSAKPPGQMSWFQAEPEPSLGLIRSALPPRGSVIDVGGGASVLVDRLLELDVSKVAVLEISDAALEESRKRLGPGAGRVRWITADVTELDDVGQFDIWHDRAVFHFLTDPADRRRYAQLALKTVPSGGHLIIATFGPQGPAQCSGLPVCRYDAAGLAAELGPEVELVREVNHEHVTPWGKPQQFTFALFRRR